MLDPITLATAGLTGFFVQSACGGLVGNEAHRFYRHVMSRLDGDQAEKVNHDIARAVRSAQIDALDRVLAGYATQAPSGPAQPTDFLAAATTFCRTQRRRIRTDPASLALPSAEPLEATIDGLLAHSPAGSLAGQRDQALAAFAEDAVLAELRDGPPPIAVPDDFAAYLSKGAGSGHPRFLDEFAADVRKAVKSDPRFRDIFLLSGIAELKAQGFETGEAIARIETQFGINRREIISALGQIEKVQAEHTAMLQELVAFARSSGATQRAVEQGIPEAAVRAIVLRLGGEGIARNDLIPWLDNWIAAASEELGRRSNEGEAFEAARKEAERRFRAGRIKDASAAFMDELAREERQEAERQAERKHHRARLLEEAIRFDELAFDVSAAVEKLRLMASINGATGTDALGAWFFNKAGEFYDRGRDKGANAALAIAIAAYRAALEERTRERVPLDWAKTQNNLGNALATLGARESATARLAEAVAAYRVAVEEMTRERVPLDWARTQNNLGNALATLGARESATALLAEAVVAYRAALEEWRRERVPLDWATTQNNLGTALQTLGERESGTERLEEAVAAYRGALEEQTRERVPLDWAMTQNNLGTALQTLGARESGTVRLEEAAAAYRAALEEWTRERLPLSWAMTQNNLGNALRELGERESGTARLTEAAAAYRAALEEMTRERVPLDWATTQNNLGTVLHTLGARESGTARLEESIATYRAALEERTREQVPLDWSATQNNLGNALATLGARESGTARLEQAVAAYCATLEEWTRERVPLDWSATQNNLGNALATLGAREGGTARLEEAATAYRAALEEGTRERVPLDWARTQNNLGAALRTLGERESGTARLEEAVVAWDQCLTVLATSWPPEWVEPIRANREATLAEIARRANPPA